MSYQVIVTDESGRNWDSIRPSVAAAIVRIGQHLSLEDEHNLQQLGQIIIAEERKPDYSIEWLTFNGFTVTVKHLGD